MQQLSAMDAIFLYIETPETPMHGLAVRILELPEGYSEDFFAEFERSSTTLRS
jgi:diacylglycerol O-acyltransferase